MQHAGKKADLQYIRGHDKTTALYNSATAMGPNDKAIRSLALDNTTPPVGISISSPPMNNKPLNKTFLLRLNWLCVSLTYLFELLIQLF